MTAPWPRPRLTGVTWNYFPGENIKIWKQENVLWCSIIQLNTNIAIFSGKLESRFSHVMRGRPTTNLSGVVCVKMSSLDKIVELGIHLKSQSQNKKNWTFSEQSFIINLVRFTRSSQPTDGSMAGHIPSGYNLLPLCGIQILVSVKRILPTFLYEW